MNNIYIKNATHTEHVLIWEIYCFILLNIFMNIDLFEIFQGTDALISIEVWLVHLNNWDFFPVRTQEREEKLAFSKW